MVGLHGTNQPGLIPVLNKLIEKTWKTPLKPGYKGELQVLVDNLALKQLMALAADPKHAENVRGEALYAITELSTWRGLQVVSAEPRWKAALYFGLHQIKEFSENPDKFIPAPALEMPPGAPIGMPDNEFEY